METLHNQELVATILEDNVASGAGCDVADRLDFFFFHAGQRQRPNGIFIDMKIHVDESRHHQIPCPPQGKEAAKAEKPGYPRNSPRQADGEAADRPESGRFQHRNHRPLHQGV